MQPRHDIAQIINLYREADRSSVKARYEELFGEHTTTETFDSSLDQSTEEEFTDEEFQDVHERIPSEEGVWEEHLDAELTNVFDQLQLSRQIEDMLVSHWEIRDEPSKIIALHYIQVCADIDSSFTIWHGLEGLLAYFGIEAASHLGHCLFPNEAFPFDQNLTYQELRDVLVLFGIHYDEGKKLLPLQVWLNMSRAVEAFRSAHQLEPWQMWALVYDLGPRLLLKSPDYPASGAPRVWVVATNNSFGEFEEIDSHGQEYVGAWAINRQARRGDLALMYCVSPRSAIVSVYRCASDAHWDPFGGWNGFRAQISDKIGIPWIAISEMKADPVLKEWKLVRCNFQGLLMHEVPRDTWNRITELVALKDPDAGERLQQFPRAAEGVRAIKISKEKWSEAEVEEQVVIPFLKELGWMIGRTVVRQVEFDIKVGSGRPLRVRADFVGYADSLSSQPLFVLETKRRIQSAAELRRAVEQAESYAGKLRCHRFAVAAPEGLWIYDLKFPTQSEEIAFVELESNSFQPHMGKLLPLMGFEVLCRHAKESQ